MKVERQLAVPVFQPITITIETQDEFEALLAISGYDTSVRGALEGKHMYSLDKPICDIPLRKVLKDIYDNLCTVAGL